MKEDEKERLCTAFKPNSPENVRRRKAIEQEERSEAAESKKWKARIADDGQKASRSGGAEKTATYRNSLIRDVESGLSTTSDAR